MTHLALRVQPQNKPSENHAQLLQAPRILGLVDVFLRAHTSLKAEATVVVELYEALGVASESLLYPNSQYAVDREADCPAQT